MRTSPLGSWGEDVDDDPTLGAPTKWGRLGGPAWVSLLPEGLSSCPVMEEEAGQRGALMPRDRDERPVKETFPPGGCGGGGPLALTVSHIHSLMQLTSPRLATFGLAPSC